MNLHKGVTVDFYLIVVVPLFNILSDFIAMRSLFLSSGRRVRAREVVSNNHVVDHQFTFKTIQILLISYWHQTLASTISTILKEFALFHQLAHCGATA